MSHHRPSSERISPPGHSVPAFLARLGFAVLLLVTAACVSSVPTSAANITVCKQGCTYSDLQVALDRAKSGDTLLLKPGENYEGNFRLPANRGEWITVTTSGKLVGDRRPTFEDAAQMPHILTPNDQPALITYWSPFWDVAANSTTFNSPGGRQHQLKEGDRVIFGQSGECPMPQGLSPGVAYYVHVIDGSNWSLSLTPGGPPVKALAHAGCYFQDMYREGTAKWRFLGLDISLTKNGTGMPYMLVALGVGDETGELALPNEIVFEKGVIRGLPNDGSPRSDGPTRCVSMQTRKVAFLDMLIADCHKSGFDSQAIAGWNTPGPVLISNSYLEGAGENIIMGGALPGITGMIHCRTAPGCILRQNYFRKPWSWKFASGVADPQGPCLYDARGGEFYRNTATNRNFLCRTGVWEPTIESRTRYLVKNLFELKNTENMVIEDTLLRNNWPDGQAGWAIVYNQAEYYAPWTTIRNVSWKRALLTDSLAGIDLAGQQYGKYTETPTNLSFEDVVMDLRSPSNGDSILLARVNDVTLRRISVVARRSWLIMTGPQNSVPGLVIDRVAFPKVASTFLLDDNAGDCRGLRFFAPKLQITASALSGIPSGLLRDCSTEMKAPQSTEQLFPKLAQGSYETAYPEIGANWAVLSESMKKVEAGIIDCEARAADLKAMNLPFGQCTGTGGASTPTPSIQKK